MNLPEKIGVTATFSLNYRAPTRGDHVSIHCWLTSIYSHVWLQFVILKTRLVEAKGRKATVSGRLEDLNGSLLVDAQYVSSPQQLFHRSCILQGPDYPTARHQCDASRDILADNWAATKGSLDAFESRRIGLDVRKSPWRGGIELRRKLAAVRCDYGLFNST
jgi:hypothetical protein